jgi:hypothetical protein
LEEITVGTHESPDLDCVISCAILVEFGGYRISSYQFLGSGDVPLRLLIKGKVFFLDRGRGDLDHHGKEGCTSTLLAAKKVGIAEQPWIKPILRWVEQTDLEGQSLPFQLSTILKGMVHSGTPSEKIMEKGVKWAKAILRFHQQKKERKNEKVREEIIKILREKAIEEVPPRLATYIQKLTNPQFSRIGDVVEIWGGLEEDKEKMEMLTEVMMGEVKDFELFKGAEKEIREKGEIEVVGEVKIGVIESANPKISSKWRSLEECPHVILQRQTNGHNQITFNKKSEIRELIYRIAEEIVARLRKAEAKKKRVFIPPSQLTTDYSSVVAEWYFHTPTPGEVGGIFNGSLTAPNIPPSKLSKEEIIKIIKEAVETVLKEKSKEKK